MAGEIDEWLDIKDYHFDRTANASREHRATMPNRFPSVPTRRVTLDIYEMTKSSCEIATAASKVAKLVPTDEDR